MKNNDAKLVEYETLQKFRLEWSMAGHRWGYILLPFCTAILGVIWRVSSDLLPFAIPITIVVIIIWRYVHHYFDDAIKRLYRRLVEIEEELGMKFTREYLTTKMQKSDLFKKNFKEKQLVTSAFIRREYEDNSKEIFGSRGLWVWDSVSGGALFVLFSLFVIIWRPVPNFLLSVLISLSIAIPIQIFYWYYAYRKYKQD